MSRESVTKTEDHELVRVESVGGSAMPSPSSGSELSASAAVGPSSSGDLSPSKRRRRKKLQKQQTEVGPKSSPPKHRRVSPPKKKKIVMPPVLKRADTDSTIPEVGKKTPPVAKLIDIENGYDEDDVVILNGKGTVVVAHQKSDSPSMVELQRWKMDAETANLSHISLHQLARDGDSRRMRQALDATTSVVSMVRRVNQRDEDNFAPLHYAARYSHFPVVRLLVERGADCNAAGEDGITPLHFAARCKRQVFSAGGGRKNSVFPRSRRARSLEDVNEATSPPRAQSVVIDELGLAKPRLLSDMTAKTSVLGGSGLLAVETENVVDFLVESGARPDARDRYGMTPLHYAAMRGNAVVARQLIKMDAVDVDIADHQGMTALHAACAHGWPEVVEMVLSEGADVHAVDEQNNTALHYAAQEGNLKEAKMLIEFAENDPGIGGYDVAAAMLEAMDYENNTPFHLAVDNGHFQTSKYLLLKGTNVNTHRVMFNTPLHAACVNGDVRVVELLVENGAKVDARNADQQHTPLHKAAAYNHHEAVEYLIRRGASFEDRDRDGFTPLLIAASEGHAETLTVLLLHGASVAAVDRLDRTAVYLACEFNTDSVLQTLLRNEDARTMIDRPDRYNCTPLHVAARKGYKDLVKLLLDAGALLDAKDEEEKTPLHLAAKFGRTRIVRELVRRSKLIVSDEDEDSNTPLHIAATEGHWMVVRELLEAGADIAARNNVLWTPLDCASGNGWVKTATLLLDYDAPVDPLDKSKTTPLHLASRAGHVDVVSLLLERGAQIDQLDHQNRNCLDLAILGNHKSVAQVIVHDKNWKLALRHWTVDTELGQIRETPLRKLIKRLPDVAEEVFDRCMVVKGHPERPDYKITFDYEFLDDTYCNWPSPDEAVTGHTRRDSKTFNDLGELLEDTSPYTNDETIWKYNHPMMIMVQSEREHLLGHPLVISLLRHKWNKYGRHIYYSALIIYCLFLMFLTSYVLMTPPPYNVDGRDRSKELLQENCEELAKTVKPKTWSIVSKTGIVVFTLVHIAKELYQMYQRGMAYVSWENLIEWTVYVLSLLLVLDLTECSDATGLRMPIQWQIGAVDVFLAWFNLVLMVRKFPQFGIYVVMFTDILATFGRFFVVFLLFIVAFAISFFALFQNHQPFRSFPTSILKTTVMMIGEFEYDALFSSSVDNDTDGGALSWNQTVFYRTQSYLIFALFVMLMTILIMNLLIGLAVDDIKAVQEKAILTRLAMQVELVLHVEQALPERFRRRWLIGCQTLYPNQHTLPRRIKRWFIKESTQLSVDKIARQINREKDKWDELRANQETMAGTIKEMRRFVDEMRNQQDRLHSMMGAMLLHLDVHWEDQDEFR